jgi:hypothetical protein
MAILSSRQAMSEPSNSTPRETPTVSSADEEGIKRILIDTLFGLG